MGGSGTTPKMELAFLDLVNFVQNTMGIEKQLIEFL